MLSFARMVVLEPLLVPVRIEEGEQDGAHVVCGPLDVGGIVVSRNACPEELIGVVGGVLVVLLGDGERGSLCEGGLCREQTTCHQGEAEAGCHCLASATLA